MVVEPVNTRSNPVMMPLILSRYFTINAFLRRNSFPDLVITDRSGEGGGASSA
jgi:hypothetical protein